MSPGIMNLSLKDVQKKSHHSVKITEKVFNQGVCGKVRGLGIEKSAANNDGIF